MKANSDTVLFAKITTTLFIVGFAIIALLASSCTSRSGQYDKIPLEKVEILSMTSVDIEKNLIYYRVKRIELDIVTTILLDRTRRYEPGDVIQYRFLPTN